MNSNQRKLLLSELGWSAQLWGAACLSVAEIVVSIINYFFKLWIICSLYGFQPCPPWSPWHTNIAVYRGMRGRFTGLRFILTAAPQWKIWLLGRGYFEIVNLFLENLCDEQLWLSYRAVQGSLAKITITSPGMFNRFWLSASVSGD